MRQSLPLRYSLPAVLLLGALLIGLANYGYNTRLATQEVVDEGKIGALALNRTRDNIESALQRGDLGQVSYILAELGAGLDIINSSLVDENGTVLAAARQESIGTLYQPAAALGKPTSGSMPGVIVAGNTLYIRYPVSLNLTAGEAHAMRRGYLYIETDLSRRLSEWHSHIRLQALAFGGFLAVIALVLWFYLHLVIEKRVAKLQNAAQQIGQGKLDTRVELAQGDEFGDLAQNFNTMALQLEGQHSQLRALQQALDEHAIVSITDIGGRITYVNDRFCRISRYSRDELIGQNHRLLKSKAHDDSFYQELWQTIASGQVWQGVIQNRRKDGSPYWVQSTIVPITDEQHRPTQYISVRTDVTQRERLRQAMEQLATAMLGGSSYNAIANAVRTGLECRWAGLGLIINSGQKIEYLVLGGDHICRVNLEGQFTALPCADVQTYKHSVVITDHVTERYPEATILAKLGARSYRSEPLINDDGMVIGVLFAIDDKPCSEDESELALMRLAAKRATQEIRRAEVSQMLHDNQAQLSEAQRMAQIGSWTLDLTTHALTWSDEVFRIFEIDKERFDASYGTYLGMIHPDDRDMVNQAYTAAVETRTAYSSIHRLRMNDGRIKWVHERGETDYDASGKPLRSIGYVHDISERKQAEQEREHLLLQLQQAQKMEALGQLTGGIAHDFNNILTAMIGFTELTLDLCPPESTDQFRQYLGHVLQAGERASALVKQMLTFGRTRPGEQKPVAASSLIKEVAKLLSATIPSSITLTINSADNTPPLLADPVQLHQVVTNLLINARDAVGEHGNIELALAGAHHYKGVCSSCHQNYSGNFIEISIKDDGHGIPAALQDRIFEPFFTTKEVGKGSGMGLAMVHGILHQGNGHIMLESSPETGTRFRLLFPPAIAEEPLITVQESALPKPVLMDRKIMIIDDEPAISAFLSELLQSQGYQVSVFNDPAAALNTFRNNTEAFDLVITDQTMPNLTGAKLAEQLLALRPTLPIILCTGYSSTIDEVDAYQLGIAVYLKKPFSNRQLLEHVTTLLEGRMAQERII